MCGRINIIDDPSLRLLLQSLGVAQMASESRFNVAPTERIPVVTGPVEARDLRSMRWWLTPSWSQAPSTRYSMFNAKCETIARSRAFRGPFRNQRAVVPISSFIEWNTGADGKQAWLIQSEQGALALAAIWDYWERDGQSLYSCSLLTTAAAASFEAWHHRMPVMLRPEDFDDWLDPAQQIKDFDRFFAPRLVSPLRVSPLVKAVNNARNKDPVLLRPAAPGQRVAD